MQEMNQEAPKNEPAKKPPGRPKKRHEVVNMRFDSKLLAKVDKAAKREKLTRTAWIEAAAESHLIGSKNRAGS
jgi:hypothetical protein